MKEKSLQHIEELYIRHPLLKSLEKELLQAIELLIECIKNNGRIFVCGNGGSAADAEHIVGELVKSFMKKRPIKEEFQKKLQEKFPHKAEYFLSSLEEGICAHSLVSGVALPTAFANDVAADMVFAQQFYALAKKEDILWALSTSGNSTNVNNALAIAKTMDCKTLAFSGKSGGEMASYLDVELRIPSDSTPVIQEYHLPLYHTICCVLEEELF